MKKVFLFLSVIGLAFASCTPDEGEKDSVVLGAGEFEMSVSNVTEVSATLKISPKTAGRTFYWGLASEASFAEFANTAAYMQDYYDSLKSAVDAGAAAWTGEGGILDNAAVEFTTEKLNPNTNYILWAFGIDENGNLTSKDLTYVKFTTKESNFDVTTWYGYWDVTSPKHIKEEVDAFEQKLVTNFVDEPLKKTLAVAPGEDLEEGYVYVYGFDGVFDLELPAVGLVSANSIKLINDFVLFTEEDEDYGPLDYTWNGYSWIEDYSDFVPVGGDYAPYTLTMAADGSATVKAYVGQLTSGAAFMTDMYRVSAVITTGQYEGYSLGFSRQDGEPALFLNGETMTGVKVGELEAPEAPAKLSSKKFRAVHKMATPKAAAHKFSSAVNFAK